MGVITLTDPVAGTMGDATIIANNNAAIKAAVNGGLDAANFAAGKIFDNTKIVQAGATVGQALVWNGTSWVPGSASAKTYRKATSKTVNTTVAATDLLNGEITLAAADLGTSGLLRLTAWGDWLQNIGTNQVPPRFQVLLGGTTIIDTGTLSGGISSGATRYTWELDVLIANAGAANAQIARLRGKVLSASNSTGVAAFTTGQGSYLGLTQAHLLDGTNSGLAVNTALSCALVLNVINGNAGAAYETKLLGALVEIV